MQISADSAKNFALGFEKIENEIRKVIIGQKDIIRDVLAAIIIGGNALLEGLPGLGKTQLVKAFGQALNLEFKRVQFTPDLMPADVTGTNIFSKEGDFKFQKGPLFTNLLLADEINRATPKTQSALLEAMQEKTVTSGKTTYPLPSPFFVLATQNPIELEGTYPLPEAQLDRFLMKLIVKFPTKNELTDIVKLTTRPEIPSVTGVCDCAGLEELSRTAASVPTASAVFDYAMDIILRGHPELPEAAEITKKYVRFGSSPRGAQSLISLGRVYALLDGRYNVAFDDIKKAAPAVLRHRLFLNFEASADGISPDDIIGGLL